jgi:transposase
MLTEQGLADKLATVLPHLNERQRRVLLAAEARARGYGGVTQVARAAGVSRQTVHTALHELDQPARAAPRIRRPGGGRKAAATHNPALLTDLEALVDPDTRGDPMSPLRWTCKRTRQLAAALAARGHRVSHQTVAALLRAADYSLQAPVTTLEGTQHPDRDAQFRSLNEQTKAYLAHGWPVVVVDTKKKELVGPCKNGGRDWQPTGQPERVNVHDFPDPAVGKAIPYGIYDVGRNAGWVSVGRDHDTVAFAVASLRRWWQMVGPIAYPQADRLLICADGGGSNGYRLRLWKVELQRWATETGLAVTVCHLPPGTSTWNKIEHRLFAQISTNWRGRPLVSHEVIVDLIGATTTTTGLRVQAELDPGVYPTKIKVSDEEMAALHLTPHPFHGEWTYSIAP